MYIKLNKNFYKFLIFIIFFSLYFPQTLLLNEDYNLLMAYEVDPGSIVMSTHQLFNEPKYNMFNGYHSSHYGWSWFSLCFVFLTPFKILFSLFHIEAHSLINFLIKFLYFTVGLLSSFAVFRLCEKLLNYKNLYIGFLISIIYCLNPLSKFFYFIKPELLGVFMIFLSLIFTIDFYNKGKNKHYFYSLIFLILALLSRQQFIFICIVLGFLNFKILCEKKNINFKDKSTYIFITKHFLKIISLFLIIFFLIHPYAFFNPLKFQHYQVGLGRSFGSDQITFLQSFVEWTKLIKNNFFYIACISIILISFFLNFLIKKEKKIEWQISLSMIITFIVSILFFSYVNRLVINQYYLFVLMPVFIFGILTFAKILLIIPIKNKFLPKIIIIILLIIPLSAYTKPTLEKLNERQAYKQGIQYKAYSYIKKNLNIDDRVANDHFVVIPLSLSKIECHYWRECNSYERIKSNNPNYVMFKVPIPVYSWSDNPEAKSLKKYAEDNKMKLIKKIKYKKISDSILIYKKF